MDKHPPNILASIFRGCRIVLHLLYGMLLAIFYPHLKQSKQRRMLKVWSRQLLCILNIGIQIEGEQPTLCAGGCMMVANHVSWLDIFVLNAIQPSRFIAKAEVRGWPVIGWLCQRSGTIFIERTARKNSTLTNQQISALLKQGICIGLFPEGTTTDGQQVGHFHSALIQPAIDAGARLHPVTLRYQDNNGDLSEATAFTGNMTLARSIWRILRSDHHNALIVFTTALAVANQNRRALARAAQQNIAQSLLGMASKRHPMESAISPQTPYPEQSAYVLLLDPAPGNRTK